MKQIGIEEITLPHIYKENRDEIVGKIIELKKQRRVSTRTFSFLFEEKETVLDQINEMLFIENIEDENEIREMIEIYSDLLPEKNELSVSMFIEFSDQEVLVKELPKLVGVENKIYLVFDDDELAGTPEEGRSTEVLESTLQYLRFKFTDSLLRKFTDAKNVFIECRHPRYEESVRIPPKLLDDLKKEISSQ